MSWVSVPVLSVHSTSIAPKFWIASRRLMITFWRDRYTAPLARVEVTIIGSISGVRPTAIDSANRNASVQAPGVLPFVKPLISSTIGVITIMKRISSQLTLFTPVWNALVVGLAAVTFWASAPKYVWFAIVTTTPVAEPLTTFVPMNAMLSSSNGLLVGGPRCSENFSTGSDSPVIADWLTNRSLADSSRMSAGIMSPADSSTTSPGTSRFSRISTRRGGLGRSTAWK